MGLSERKRLKRYSQFSPSEFYHSEIQKSGTERRKKSNDRNRPRSRRKNRMHSIGKPRGTDYE